MHIVEPFSNYYIIKDKKKYILNHGVYPGAAQCFISYKRAAKNAKIDF